MGNCQKDNKSNEDFAIEAFENEMQSLRESKEYEEILQKVEQALKEKELSIYYYWRAIAHERIYDRDHSSSFGDEELLNISEDLDRAIRIDNHEQSLWLKCQWLRDVVELSYLPTGRDLGKSVKGVTEEGDILYSTNFIGLTEDRVERINDEIEELFAKLLSLYPSAKYYAKKARWSWNNKLEYINKAVELDDSLEYVRQKAYTEKHLGLKAEALKTAERLQNISGLPEDRFLYAELLAENGRSEAIDAIMFELRDYKIESGEPYLLSKYSGYRYVYNIELLIDSGRFEAYANLISYYYAENPQWVDVKLLSEFHRNEKYALFLKHFTPFANDSQVILWFRFWAFAGIGSLAEAETALEQINTGKFNDEVFDTYQNNDQSKINNLYHYRTLSKLDSIVSVFCFHQTKINLFLKVMAKLFHSESVYNAYELAWEEKGRSVNQGPISLLDTLNLMQLTINHIEQEQWIHLWDDKDDRSDDEKTVTALDDDLESIKFELLKSSIGQRLSMSILQENEQMLRIAQIEERNRILSNLSHSIKNMLRSVIDPLINLREEFPQKANVIDNAIKGAHLIREIVNSINLSYETNIEDISWDITHPDAESITLQEMLLNSLKYSIGNMFDFRYFPQYAENYYPRSIPKDDFENIKAEWNAVSSVNDFDPLVAFAEKHLCKLSVKLSEAAQYKLGNEKSSAIKLMIMFQEIIFNAVKYASFVPRAERFLEIRLDNTETTIIFEVSNSYRPEVQAKTTGVGKLVIENFSTILGTNPELKTTDTTYSVSIEFNNLWRNNAKDTVH